MYCQNCGKILSGNENFCSNCGTKIETQVIDEKFEQQQEEMVGFVKESKPAYNIELPKMNWDTLEFVKEKKEIDAPFISWRTEDMFLGKELKENYNKPFEEQTEEESAEEEKKQEPKEKVDLAVLEIFKTKDRSKELEFLREDTVVEVTQPSENIAIEVSANNEEKPIINQPEMTSAILNEEEIEQLEAIIAEAKDKEEQSTTTKEDKSLFDEIAKDVANTIENSKIDEEKKRIDRFYTFNKKKEEFQRLLDKEYERIENNIEKGGLEEEVSAFIDVEVGKEVEGTSQLEEMMRARELFFDSPVTVDILNTHIEDEIDSDQDKENELKEETEVDIVETFEEIKDEVQTEEVEEEKEIPIQDIIYTTDEMPQEVSVEDAIDKIDEIIAEKDKAVEVNEIDSEVEEVENAYVQVPFEEKAEVATQIVIEPNQEKDNSIAEEFFADEEVKGMSGGKKFLLAILIILLILSIGILGIRLVMPTSYISQYVDNIANKVISVFNSDKKEKTKTKSETIMDKTNLIQKNKDKNFNNQIENIVSDQTVRYKEQDNAKFADLSTSRQSNGTIWYRDEKNTDVTYDNAVVASLIGYISHKNAYITDKNKEWENFLDNKTSLYQEIKSSLVNNNFKKITTLKIGEIRIASNKIYCWVKEESENGQVNKIYQFTPNDKQLFITDERKN